MSISEDLIRNALNAHLDGKPYGAVVEFCRKSGIKKHNLQRYRKPGAAIPVEVLDGAARGLGVSPATLVSEAPATPPPQGSRPLSRAAETTDDRESLLGRLVARLATLEQDQLDTVWAFVKPLSGGDVVGNPQRRAKSSDSG